MTDIIIIGGGPAGLSAAIYARRAGLSVLVLDKGAAECQLAKAAEVENYLGFESISGTELRDRFASHAAACGVETVKKAVLGVEKADGVFRVSTRREVFEARFVIIAVGRSHKSIGSLGEEKFVGSGVSYCATCDGYFFKDKRVAVVGGGDSALSQAIYLSSLCSEVYLVHRRDTFRAAHYLVERARERDNIKLITESTVAEIYGNERVEGIRLISTRDGAESALECDGVFGAVGEAPNMKFTVDGLHLGAGGLIPTDELCATNIEGLYAVGDIREKRVYQIVTAVADGALAIEGILGAEGQTR